MIDGSIRVCLESFGVVTRDTIGTKKENQFNICFFIFMLLVEMNKFVKVYFLGLKEINNRHKI